MLLQTLPAQAQAEEKVNTTVMASESQQAAQTPNGSETQYNGITSENESGKNNSNETSTEQPEDTSESNSKSEAEENQPENESNKSDSNIEESAQENTKQTDAEQETTADEVNPTDATENEIQVVDNKVTLTSTADFINLSNQPAEKYETAEITITRGTNTSFDLTETVNGKTFQGFGSAEHPFKGTIVITSSGSGIDIPINRPFFEYLDQSATINTGLYLKAKGTVNRPLLAANYKNNSKLAETKTISLMIGADENEQTSFGGIIGTMDEKTSLSLSVENKITDNNITITGTGNLGFFCNTMEAGANLTIESYTDANSTNSGSTGNTPVTIGYNISTTGGHAGGLVGEMQDGATLTVNQALELTGNVTTTATGSAAGGLIGAATNPTITLNNPVTRTGTIKGTSESGGFIGKAVYNTGLELDLSKINISGITISNGNHAGGYFGVLNFDSASGGTITMNNLLQTELTHKGESWQFGGVIGQYSANSQSSTLKLESSNVKINGNGAVTALGGIIGSVAGSGADHALGNATSSYVEISNASVVANLTTNLNGGSYFGGLVGELGQAKGQGHFLSVSGATTVSGNDDGKASKLGGILGKSTKGILRISGTTDLSGLTIKKTGTECGQIAGSIDGTIIYALGSGNGTGGEGYDWKYIRPAAVPVSDIGSYGEVIRLDGSKLKETDGSSADSNTLFTKDPNSHQLSVAYTQENALEVSNTRDLAAVAVLLQQGNDLLNKNITVNCDVDLTETGIYSLLRDNGSQKYTGTFNGNNHTITLAAGEAYGYLSDSTLAANENGTSATVGIGQIYNHSTIGFIPYCNGKVQNLILNGSIYFHNVSNGVDVRCGAVAGYTDGAVFENVTVNTKIVYRDGAGGAGLKVMSIGGFLGRAKGKTTFKGCSMQGTISSSSGCYDFAIGGYVAVGEEGVGEEGANISFSNCGISNATIKHEKFKDNSNAPNALFGGLIGCMTGNVTINGLTINHLQMKSYATETAGGLLGYYWRKNSATDSVSINNLEVLNSVLDVQGKFGGLVYSTDAYWKIGDGTGANGIKFSASNSFSGKTEEANPSALLVCSTIQDEANKKYDKAYIEIRKDGLKIEENAVNVTLTGGDYFDDIAGKTKYGEDGNNAVVSIGLTSPNADSATLIDKDNCNTWTNQCNVNNGKSYTNKNTRYYYNVDYYRKYEGTDTNITEINSAGKLLLRSLHVYAQPNLQQYFVKGSDDFKLTGTIDLRGVSYYPMSRAITIQGATVIFDYTNMNTNTVKKYNDSNQQHYQMQTGLFSKISQKFTVNKLTLHGTFGKYEDGKAGVLICDSIAQESTNKDQAGITITNLTLDGIQCNDGTELPLLVNSVGSNTAISMNGVTFTREKYTTPSALTDNKVASALMGQVGSSTAQKISLEFSNMDLNRAGNDSIFKTAIFATAFQYGDGASGGSYNFESTAEKITFGKEISNGVSSTESTLSHNRNSYNKENVTGQVWYLDTFGNTTEGSYVGADKTAINTDNESGNKPANSPQDFSSYLPYIGKSENSVDKYYELDINQKAVYLVDGCGTYGHPWVIQDVSSTDGSNQTLFTGEDQMMTVMKLLDDTGRNGTAIKINKTVLESKMAGQGGITAHTGDVSDDMVFIKNGNTWVEATLAGNRYVQKTDSNPTTLTNEQVMAYLRNGYFQIKKNLTLDVAQFTGFGKDDVSRAFSGVIVGDTAARTITLTGVNTTGEVGGLIRYSQGSVVKNLTIVLDKVTFNGNSTETFFGGVIGWVIGGDNIIDNVILTVNSVNKGSSAKNLTAVGGYVGMVGGYVKGTTIDQSKKGGGVVFRNISSAGLTSISGTATNTKVSAGNTNYYWNPYVGRVFDGYACAEASCSGMGTNTDKNYTIPKLDKDVKLKIKGNGRTNISDVGSVYPNSTITLDSEQSIWLLSAIVNSGFGAKTAGGNFALTNGKPTGDTNYRDYRVDASYYGRTRTGTYDGVGRTISNQADVTDENDYWGGKLIKDGTEVDRRKHSTSYLSTYVDTQGTSGDAKAVTYSLTMDNLTNQSNGRSVTFDNKTYDLSSYGNGFRGIGYNYGLPTDSTQKDIQKSRALRLQNQSINGPIAVAGNGATIKYSRTIYEMSSKDISDISVTQAGFFTQCLANSSVDYTVKDLNFTGVTLKKNVGENNVALGVAFARDGAYSPKTLTFDDVNVTNSAIDQADQGAAVIGYMSNLTNNKEIRFTGCSVEGFTAGTNNNNSTNKMNHCGAFIGKADSPKNVNRSVTFKNCTSTNISMYNVQNGGLFAGYVNGTCTINGGSADIGTITSRTAVGGGGYSMGGLIGKAESTLNIEGTTETPVVSVKNISIRETKDVNSTSKSYAGGVAGSAASTNIQNVDVDNIRLAGKDLGGLIGCVNGSADMKNVKISNSYLANCSQSTDQRAVGGFFGIINGTFNGFNLLMSKDNVIGYAVKDNKFKSSVSSEELSKLSADSIGLPLEDGTTYAAYSSLTANASLESETPCGIWVGNANNNLVNIVSASRQGKYSAVNNIGAGKTESSYVIYADYTGQSTTSSTVNTTPNAIVTVGNTPLTGDGATKVNETAVRDSIISDVMKKPSLMKGYYGGDQSRPLDETVQKFGTNGDYSSRLSNYQKEDTSSTSNDFPILVLNATTKSELNSIVNNYISMLTNTKQDQSKHYYANIAPQTYKYENNAWNPVSQENQTMSWNSTDGVSINRGKYDNNKQQITILDVSYEIKVQGSTEVYHLYIPVLVKKLMDVECSVKVVNGAAGYDPATDEKATLNSFGENYTAHISYTYKWMVSEWQSMLENGDSLLWNFDKTVKLGRFKTLDRSKIHLTLVDMNTQGTQTSYHQSTLEELSTAGVLTDDTLNLAEMAKRGKSSYICDLLPLEATESATGGFKKVESADPGAVLRIWNETEHTFIYYAAKSDTDAKDTKYYNVTLNTQCGLNDILPVKEEYYLVMNCTEGNATTPMLNTELELNQLYNNQQIPTNVTDVTSKFSVVYLLGDFYKLDNVTLNSESTTQNQEMVSGSNDSIKVTVSSKVSAAANEIEFGSYVNDRSIYYQYSLQTVDQSGKPVDMKGAASIPTLKLEKKNADGTVTTHVLKQLTDLSGTENGFITQFGENGYIITIKAPGKWYTGATITAEMSFSYNSTDMNQQFPVRRSDTENTGVKFKVDAVMAYQQDSLGSSGISASATEEKLYYQLKEAQAKLSYDSYNITSKDGNTSQLGINGRENDNAAMEISSRALLDVTDFTSFNLTDESNSAYPYYLEGELIFAQKTDSENGTSYKDVAIGDYLSDFVIESAGKNADVTSKGLGLQENKTVYKFRIQLTQEQVNKILDTPLLVNIKYNVKTRGELEAITGGQYANYKVTLSATLKNKSLNDLLKVKPSDYLIYTNAKVYLKIVG